MLSGKFINHASSPNPQFFQARLPFIETLFIIRCHFKALFKFEPDAQKIGQAYRPEGGQVIVVAMHPLSLIINSAMIENKVHDAARNDNPGRYWKKGTALLGRPQIFHAKRLALSMNWQIRRLHNGL